MSSSFGTPWLLDHFLLVYKLYICAIYDRSSVWPSSRTCTYSPSYLLPTRTRAGGDTCAGHAHTMQQANEPGRDVLPSSWTAVARLGRSTVKVVELLLCLNPESHMLSCSRAWRLNDRLDLRVWAHGAGSALLFGPSQIGQFFFQYEIKCVSLVTVKLQCGALLTSTYEKTNHVLIETDRCSILH
jgi:hypothetical protein